MGLGCRVSGFEFQVSGFKLLESCPFFWGGGPFGFQGFGFQDFGLNEDDEYSGSIKYTTHLDHMSHGETASGTNWSNKWTYREYTRCDEISRFSNLKFRGQDRAGGAARGFVCETAQLAPPRLHLGFGLRVLRFAFRVPGFGCRVSGAAFRVSVFGFRICIGFRVSGFDFRVLSFENMLPLASTFERSESVSHATDDLCCLPSFEPCGGWSISVRG